ncbi:hypothetical protein V6N13_146456 [Hibiscus sabdariffa]|uniref:Secreted protein n=1 Tax=Hibiscus sabdariffa TaxID=183260 RepID=A0ABR2TSP0_9ROSI
MIVAAAAAISLDVQTTPPGCQLDKLLKYTSVLPVPVPVPVCFGRVKHSNFLSKSTGHESTILVKPTTYLFGLPKVTLAPTSLSVLLGVQ